MPKSKSQKKSEAEFRSIRGEIVDSARFLYELKQPSDIERKTQDIERLIEKYNTFPLDLRLNGFKGWDIEGLSIIDKLVTSTQRELALIQQEFLLKNLPVDNINKKMIKRI